MHRIVPLSPCASGSRSRPAAHALEPANPQTNAKALFPQRAANVPGIKDTQFTLDGKPVFLLSNKGGKSYQFFQ